MPSATSTLTTTTTAAPITTGAPTQVRARLDELAAMLDATDDAARDLTAAPSPAARRAAAACPN